MTTAVTHARLVLHLHQAQRFNLRKFLKVLNTNLSDPYFIAKLVEIGSTSTALQRSARAVCGALRLDVTPSLPSLGAGKYLCQVSTSAAS
jgi:hypothetical protein